MISNAGVPDVLFFKGLSFFFTPILFLFLKSFFSFFQFEKPRFSFCQDTQLNHTPIIYRSFFIEPVPQAITWWGKARPTIARRGPRMHVFTTPVETHGSEGGVTTAMRGVRSVRRRSTSAIWAYWRPCSTQQGKSTWQPLKPCQPRELSMPFCPIYRPQPQRTIAWLRLKEHCCLH